MNKQTEALKLALEALKKSRDRIVEQGGSGWKLHAQQCVNAITALREALVEQPAPAQGWKLVPECPTAEMKKAGAAVNGMGHDFAHHCWTVMLAAAPQPAQRKPLTDEQIDAEFDAFASKFDHESNKWLDMGVDAYFRAGFKAAHGIKENT